MSNNLKDVSELVIETTELNKRVQNQANSWDAKVNSTIKTIEESLEANQDTLPIIESGVYIANTAKEAIELVKKASNKTVIGGDYVVELPEGVFRSDWSLDLHNTGGYSSSRVILRGKGKGKTIIQNDGNKHMFTIRNSNFRMQDLTIDRLNHEATTEKPIYEPIHINHSKLELLNVEVKNVVQNYAIRVYHGSHLVCSGLELNNVVSGIHTAFNSVTQSESTIFNAHNTVDSYTAFDTSNNSHLNINSSKIHGGGKLTHGILGYNNSHMSTHKVLIDGVKKYGLLADKGTFCDSTEMSIKTKGLGVYASNGSYVDVSSSEIDGAHRGFRLDNAKIKANYCRLTNIDDYGFVSYNYSHIDLYESYCSLTSTGISHIHCDNSSCYSNGVEFHGGKYVAKGHYNSMLRVYNAKPLNVKNDLNEISNVHLYGNSTLQDTGSVLTCNVPDGSTYSTFGTRI